MRVFAISHSSLIAAFRRKWDVLAGLPGVHLTLLVPTAWPEGGRQVRYARCAASGHYRVVPARVVFGGIHAIHWYPSLAWHLWRARPELVHIEEEPWNVTALQASILARLAGARVLFFTWENLRRRYPFPLPIFRQATLRLADHAIAGSDEAQTILREHGFRGGIDVLPQYGIDPPSPPTVRERDGGPFTVGFVGRLVRQKGLDVLVEAVATLPDVRLLIVGDGPFRPAVVERAEAFGLGERVELAGAVEHDRVAELYRRMDVLVLPSLTTPRWKEQFGRVLVEAMAHGVPVVGSTSGEIPHVIGSAGLIFREGDAADLAATLSRLLWDPTLRERLARLGYARAVASFSNESIARRTQGIYCRLLG